jgi:very-short-patch-repair endonuclease
MALVGVDPSALRTRRYVFQQLLGAKFLGRATLEEYAAAVWMLQNDVSYVFQATLGGFRRASTADFLILNRMPNMVLEINGDRFHARSDQIAKDRQRAQLLHAEGYFVVNVWGNAILGYNEAQAPTEAQFDRVMEAAMRGRELSTPWGVRSNSVF